MKVIIDTSKQEETTVSLVKLSRPIASLTEKKVNAQLVLPLIEKILEKQHLTISDITEIEVNTGPGSFTGLRVGSAIAMTLGSLLQIPVNGHIKLDLKLHYGS